MTLKLAHPRARQQWDRTLTFLVTSRKATSSEPNDAAFGTARVVEAFICALDHHGHLTSLEIVNLTDQVAALNAENINMTAQHLEARKIVTTTAAAKDKAARERSHAEQRVTKLRAATSCKSHRCAPTLEQLRTGESA